MRKYIIILASGTGSRFGAECPKQFVKIGGKMILEYTIQACDCGVFDEMVLVVSGEYVDEMRAIVQKQMLSIPVKVVAGGRSRKESCAKGVAAIDDVEAYVVVHNGVQPFITRRDLHAALEALERYEVVSVASPSVYTVLEIDEKRCLSRIIPRKTSVNDLGPECFHKSILDKVLGVDCGDARYTNLTGIVFDFNMSQVYIVDGDPSNIKITYPTDLVLVKHLLGKRRG